MIPADILKHVIAPYLHVSSAIFNDCCLVRCVYNQPHGERMYMDMWETITVTFRNGVILDIIDVLNKIPYYSPSISISIPYYNLCSNAKYFVNEIGESLYSEILKSFRILFSKKDLLITHTIFHVNGKDRGTYGSSTPAGYAKFDHVEWFHRGQLNVFSDELYGYSSDRELIFDHIKLRQVGDTIDIQVWMKH